MEINGETTLLPHQEIMNCLYGHNNRAKHLGEHKENDNQQTPRVNRWIFTTVLGIFLSYCKLELLRIGEL